MRWTTGGKFAGALTAGWRAYNISADKASGLGDWSDEDLATYLSTGHADGHGGAAGPMGEATDNSLTYPDAGRYPCSGGLSAKHTGPANRPAAHGDVPAPASYREGVTADSRSARREDLRRRLRQLVMTGRA